MVSGERVKVNATDFVSNDVLGEGLVLELCHAEYRADPGEAVEVHVESATGMAVRCKGLTGGRRL